MISSIEAEKAVLGCVLLNNAAMDEVSFLEPSDFVSIKTRTCFEAQQYLIGHKHPVDYLTLCDRLEATKTIDKAGGLGWVTELADCVPSAANVVSYANTVRDLSRRRAMKAELDAALKMLSDGDDMSDIAARASNAVDVSLRVGDGLSTVSEAFALYEEYQTGKRSGFFLTGCESLDACAPSPSELVIIAARQSVGKTAFAVSLADSLARRGEPVAFFSIEMSGPELQFRRVAGMAGVSMLRLKQNAGIRTPAEINGVVSAFGAVNDAPMVVYSKLYSMGEMVTVIRNLKAREGIKAAFIDHLGLVDIAKAERQDIAIGNATRMLARMCKDIEVTVFLLVQLNRNAKPDSTGKLPPPRIGDLRDSGRIAENADSVWLLDRPGYNDEDDKTGDFHVCVAKNRNGPVKNITLHIDIETGRFSEMERTWT